MDFSVSPQDSKIISYVMMITGFITSVVISRKFLVSCIIALLVIVSYQVIHVNSLEPSTQKEENMSEYVPEDVSPKASEKEKLEVSPPQVIIVFPVMSMEPSGLYKPIDEKKVPEVKKKPKHKKVSKRRTPRKDTLTDEFIKYLKTKDKIDKMVEEMTEELNK